MMNEMQKMGCFGGGSMEKSQQNGKNPQGYQKDEELNLMRILEEGEKQKKTAQKLVFRLNHVDDVHVSGGPFHYQMRAGTYGDVYDEPAWKVGLGIEKAKERSAVEANPMKCKYDQSRVLLDNWTEERRDRYNIKYNNAPKLSQYGHIYKTEYSHAYTKPLCNKARDVLLKIKSFPFTAYPGHQPTLGVQTLLCSAPKPQSCIEDEQIAQCRKDAESQKRYEKQARELSGGFD